MSCRIWITNQGMAKSHQMPYLNSVKLNGMTAIIKLIEKKVPHLLSKFTSNQLVTMISTVANNNTHQVVGGCKTPYWSSDWILLTNTNIPGIQPNGVAC